MAVSVNVKFDDGAGGAITIPGPIPGSTMQTILHQAVGLTAGGTRYAYDKGVTLYRAELRFTTLSATNREALDTFFRTTVTGTTTTWTYTDTGGNTYTARFLNTELAFAKVAPEIWSVNITLELSSLGK